MKQSTKGIPTLPLWLNGHPLMVLTEYHHAICHSQTQRKLRKMPICRNYEIQLALDSGQKGLASWSNMVNATDKRHALAAWRQNIVEFGRHLDSILLEESPTYQPWRRPELPEAEPTTAKLTSAYWSDDTSATVCLQQLFSLLAQGHAVIVLANKTMPSWWFALAELTDDCGFPAGVFNLLYGDMTSKTLLEEALS